MLNKRFKFIFFAFIAVLALLGVSCSGEQNPLLSISPENPVAGPGQTSEIILSVGFSNTETKPSRKTIKTFSEAPVVSVEPSGFRLLSVIPERDEAGIRARIILRVSEEMLSGETGAIRAEWGGLKANTILAVRKNPEDYINSEGVVTDPAAYDVLVNKERRMPADYIPPDLVRIDVPTILVFEEVNHLRRAASEALSALFAAAEDEQGFELLARSGYRSHKTQVSLYQLNVREYGEQEAARISAQPGTSEHQSGLAMDISSPVVNYQLTKDFGETEEGKWVAENAHRFGFIIRYMKGREEITGYDYEPWHLRYVGTVLAEDIYLKNYTLEEYYGINTAGK